MNEVKDLEKPLRDYLMHRVQTFQKEGEKVNIELFFKSIGLSVLNLTMINEANLISFAKSLKSYLNKNKNVTFCDINDVLFELWKNPENRFSILELLKRLLKNITKNIDKTNEVIMLSNLQKQDYRRELYARAQYNRSVIDDKEDYNIIIEVKKTVGLALYEQMKEDGLKVKKKELEKYEKENGKRK